jgi:hypothetical protein
VSAQTVVLAPPRPRRRWIWISVALVTAFVVVAPVAFRLWLKAAHHDQVLPVRVYRQPLTQLRVVAPAAGVTLVPDRRDEVIVQPRLAWDFGQPAVTQAVQGKTLQVTGSCPGPKAFEDCQVDLVIHVPVNLAVDVSAGTGSISVSGLSGPLHLAVTSGSIMMTRVSGPVWASAGSGSVAGSGMKSAALNAVIGSGSLRLRLFTAPGDLTLAIGSGSASVTIPHGTRVRVSASAGAGVLDIAPGIADSAAAGTLTATIGTGVLTVGYPPPGK